MKAYRYSIIWAALVLIACLVPGFLFDIPYKAEGIKHLDKLVHFLLFLVLCFALTNDYHKAQNKKDFPIVHSLVIVSIGMIYGLFIELLQLIQFFDRSFSWFDLLSDMGGSIAGTYLYTALKKRQ